MSNSFTLAEFPGDVKALASVMRPQERRLAVTPTAMEELDGWGLPYLIDGDVCTAEELNRIGLDNFSRAEGLVDAYDRAIFDQSPTIRQVGLRPFRGHFTRVKFLLDAVTTRLNILHRLIGDGVEQVYKTLPQGPRPPTDSNLFYGADASLYGELLELLATQAGVPVTWVSRPAVPPAQSGLRLRPWAAVRRLEEFGRGVTTAFRVPRSNGTRPRRILLLSTAYDMGSVAAEYRTQGADVFWLDLSQPRLYRCPGRWPYRVSCPSTEVHSVQEEVRRLTLFQPGDAAEELCRDDGLSYAPLVRRALGLYLDHTFPRAVALRAFLEACHRKLDFDLVLSHCGPHTVETSAVFDFCHKVGVPVAVLQHGGYGYADNPVTNYCDFSFNGNFLSWGPGVEAHYGTTKRGSVRFRAVGSPTLDSIVQRRDRTAALPRRVMYVITDLRGYSAYFPGGEPWLDTVYYRFQRDVLSLLERYQDTYDIWFKIPPGTDRSRLAQNPAWEWLKARDSRIALEQRPLLEVIDKPSLFLIDFPTTTLLQCLATRAQVIVLTGAPHHAVLPEARQLLERRAVCCDSQEDFLAAVEVRLRDGIESETGGLDDTFLSRYGTFEHDGKSLARIEGCLENKNTAMTAAKR